MGAGADADGVIEAGARFLDGLPWAAIAFTPILSLFPLVLVHEIGHALVALNRVAGPVVVQVGRTRPLMAFGLGRVAFRLDPVIPRDSPVGGLCLHQPARTRADVAAIALGGPVASALVGVFAAIVANSAGPGSTTGAVFAIVAAISAVIVVWNLAPTTKSVDGRRIRSDGGIVVDAIRGPEFVFRLPAGAWIRPTQTAPADTLDSAAGDPPTLATPARQLVAVNTRSTGHGQPGSAGDSEEPRRLARDYAAPTD